MNETILNLAIRASGLLISGCEDLPKGNGSAIIRRYFQSFVANPGDIGLVDGKIFTDKLPDELCREINNTLRFAEKVYLLLLVQDCLLPVHDTPGFNDNLNHLFNCVGIDNTLINQFSEFLIQEDPLTVNQEEYLLLSPRDHTQDDMLEGRWIDDNAPSRVTPNVLELEEFSSHLLVMFVDQIKSYVIRCLNKTERLYDEDMKQQCRFRVIGPGNVLSMKGVPVLTFSGIKNKFLHLQEKGELHLAIAQVKYHRAKEISGIQDFSANESTGQLIGIVGREGVGKSTLLKLIAGKIKPDSGSISINGYDLWRYKYLLKGIIGFVPEEDLLFEDLTVSDNLTLTARLFYSSLSRKEIETKVNAVLSKLDLLELKHVVVGNLLSKHIQPGQRRMINIALELLREPQILLVDNALSGLGMSDAAKVIRILHDYSFSGNLVITSISQADSSTFMLFDKIWLLDEGGRAVYSGSVKGAPEYLLRNLKLAYQERDYNDPAQLLDLVNYRLPDKEGQVWKRVVEPVEWHDQFMRERALKENGHPAKSLLPARILKIPPLEVQLLIFSIRNFKCKFSRVNDFIKTVLTGPAIALLVALLLRFNSQGEYTLLNNANLPFYQFISVVLAIFLGLVLSADEIIRERNILEKEEYLEFSRFSYLNSKILYLFPVIAIQTLLYVGTGNLVLGIHELFWVYWLVLFSSGSFGILLGLFISTSVHDSSLLHKGVLPLVIALQLILGGGIISYDQLNLGRNKYSPVLGDLMVSKWGYEALAVEQFLNNEYDKLVYDANRKIEQASYCAFQVIPKLEGTLALCRNTANDDSAAYYTGLMQNELVKIARMPEVFPFEYTNKLREIYQNETLLQETSDYLTYLSMHFYEQYESFVQQKNRLMENLTDSLGADKLDELHQKHHNNALERTVTNSNSEAEYFISGHDIVHNKGTIYQEPLSNVGRARLFCPMKLFNGQKTDTLWFNISIIWLLTALCYLLVLFDAGVVIRKLTFKDHKSV
jgi:ABC-type multidrug transport system ATPase subunit